MSETIKQYNLQNLIILHNSSIEATLPPWDGAIMNPESKEHDFNDGNSKIKEVAEYFNLPYL